MGTRKGIQLFGLISLLVALAGCASHKKSDAPSGATQASSAGSKWGYYNGEPVTKWNPDGRTMTLLTELRYTDPHSGIWVAPIGSVVDGASLPRYLWSIMGGPFEWKYRNASVLHDVAYGEHKRPWQDCDRMFYNAMRCSGVGATEAKTMYYALYRHGRHWKRTHFLPGSAMAEDEIVPRAIAVDEQEDIAATRDWIENAKPSLAQIEARAAEAPSQ